MNCKFLAQIAGWLVDALLVLRHTKRSPDLEELGIIKMINLVEYIQFEVSFGHHYGDVK